MAKHPKPKTQRKHESSKAAPRRAPGRTPDPEILKRKVVEALVDQVAATFKSDT